MINMASSHLGKQRHFDPFPWCMLVCTYIPSQNGESGNDHLTYSAERQLTCPTECCVKNFSQKGCCMAAKFCQSSGLHWCACLTVVGSLGYSTPGTGC